MGTYKEKLTGVFVEPCRTRLTWAGHRLPTGTWKQSTDDGCPVVYLGWVVRKPSGPISVANLCARAGHDPHYREEDVRACLVDTLRYRASAARVVCLSHLRARCPLCQRAELVREWGEDVASRMRARRSL